MNTTNNNDILFDDTSMMQTLHFGNQAAGLAHSQNDCINNYGYCNNRFEIRTDRNLSAGQSASASSKGIIQYGDCNN